MEHQIRRAMERILDDESLTDELAGDEAVFLLKWCEQQVFRLAERRMPEAAFDEAIRRLRGLIRHINRLAGLRGSLDVEAQKASLREIIGAARALGLDVRDSDAERCLQSLPSLDAAEAVRSLTKLVSPAPL